MMNEQVNAESEEVNQEDQMYRENILDYYKHPRNKEVLPNATLLHRELNPLCGDDVTVYLQIENNKIIRATFMGTGCAISQASISLLTEKIIEKKLEEIKNMKKEEILEMLGIFISPGRMKCALLSLKTLIKAIEKHEQSPKN